MKFPTGRYHLFYLSYRWPGNRDNARMRSWSLWRHR